MGADRHFPHDGDGNRSTGQEGGNMFRYRQIFHFGRSVLVCALLLLAYSCAFAQDIRVTVNGDPVAFSGTGPMQLNGRVLVPVRGVLEKLGANVEWVPSTQSVIAENGS